MALLVKGGHRRVGTAPSWNSGSKPVGGSDRKIRWNNTLRGDREFCNGTNGLIPYCQEKPLNESLR